MDVKLVVIFDKDTYHYHSEVLTWCRETFENNTETWEILSYAFGKLSIWFKNESDYMLCLMKWK